MSPKKFLDLSHNIREGMITYKGLPAPIICDYWTREESKAFYGNDTTFHIGKIEMVGNTGTYIDCPFHRYENGKDFTQINLSHLVDLEGILIEAPYQSGLEIGKEFFLGKDLHQKAILIYTGWATYWNSEQYFENHPFVNEEAAFYLKEQKVKLVGIDSHNIDNTQKNTRPVHSILLKENILIVEHLCQLEGLRGHSFSFTAAPPKIENFGTFPVRAYATLH